MDNNLLGEQIAKYRKAAGLTQEDLGKAVGISAQAVSRWECGGAPDITLLPDIAKRLGVSIDALFGKESSKTVDIETAVRQWAAAIPYEQRIDQLCRLVWIAAGPLISNNQDDTIDISGYENCCESDDMTDSGAARWLRRTQITTEDGTILGIRANNMSFVSVLPEPKTGWKPFFAENEQYRKLFTVLATPDCLELLEYLHTKPRLERRRYTPGAVAKAMGLEITKAEDLMNALTELEILSRIDLETEDGLLHAYMLDGDEALVPLLYFARWLITGGGAFLDAPYRKSPMLREKST